MCVRPSSGSAILLTENPSHHKHHRRAPSHQPSAVRSRVSSERRPFFSSFCYSYHPITVYFVKQTSVVNCLFFPPVTTISAILQYMMTLFRLTASLTLLLWKADAFPVLPSHPQPSLVSSSTRLYSTKSRGRSRVSDPTGPTPSAEDQDQMETIKVEDIPELKYDPDNHPIPHQPWRRGVTDGCEDPIDAAWRQEAENMIYKSAKMVGGTVIDVTWYLTQLVIHIDDDLEKIPKDFIKTRGPVIDVVEPEDPIYYDPEDPNPEPIYADQDATEPLYERDTDQDDEIKEKMYARAEDGEEDLGLDPEDVPHFVAQETREHEAHRYAEELEMRALRAEKIVEQDHLMVDTSTISTIAGAIVDALETVEDRLRVLDRHEIVLTSPGAPDVLETQKQFDGHRGYDVAVETQDPWDSNRTLRGKLIDRNSMDILINVKGRMVTIPQNFVKCVRVPAAKRDNDQGDFEDGEEANDIYEE
jgi:ribosome maturation factor RimP